MRSKIFGLIIVLVLASGCAITQEVGTNGTTRTRVEVLPSVNVQYGVTRGGYGYHPNNYQGITPYSYHPYGQVGVTHSHEHLRNTPGGTWQGPNPHMLRTMPRFK